MKKQVKASKPRPVLVCTALRGVFFGYARKTSGTTIILERARNILYWSADVRGFVGLASDGPSATCRVGPRAEMELRQVTCVVECTPQAVAAWEAAPWSK